MRRVIIEVPIDNPSYARACMADAMSRGESPSSLRLLYSLAGLLDESDTRRGRVDGALSWGVAAEATVVYAARGVDYHMRRGIHDAKEQGRPVEYRRLGVPGFTSAPEVAP